jgi:hypothetical protein
VEEHSKTAPKHPKTAAEASRSGCLFTGIYDGHQKTATETSRFECRFTGIYINNNNMDVGE